MSQMWGGVPDEPRAIATEDTRDRQEPSLRHLVPDDTNLAYDMFNIISKVRCQLVWSPSRHDLESPPDLIALLRN